MDPEALARIGMLWLSMKNRPIQLTKIARCQDSMVHDMGRGWKIGNEKWCEKYDWFCTYEDMQERIRETYLYVFKSALN